MFVDKIVSITLEINYGYLMNKQVKIKKEDIDNKYIIDTNNLKKGDIIFSTSFKIISKTIRFFTKSKYSHVMLYVDNSSIIHADGDGVHAYNLQRLLFDDESHCIVYRLKNTTSKNDIDKIVNYMRLLIGRPYTTFEAMLTKFYQGDLKSKKVFCSRLVAQAYLESNINLVANSDYCSPEDMRKSSLLKEVSLPLRKLAELEKEIILTTDDKPFIQAEITNKLFTNIVKLTSNKNLYDIDTLSNFLLSSNNKYNNDILNIIRKSGYLTMWIKELQDNAPLYDKELYLSFIVEEQKTIYAKSSIDSLTRYENMYNNFKKLYETTNLTIFKDFLILYTILCHIESLRLSILNIIEMKEKNVFILFFQVLIKIFFLKKGLSNILESSTLNKEYTDLIQKNIAFINDNLELIHEDILKYDLKKDFIDLKTSLKKINGYLNDILYIEMRMKRSSEESYKSLNKEVNKFIKVIDDMEYLNIIINT
jgi:uncharacterized protein YycO